VLQVTQAAASPPLAVEAAPEGSTNDTSSSSNATTIAQKIDEALEKEFGEDAKQISEDSGKTFNETVKKDEVRLVEILQHVLVVLPQHTCCCSLRRECICQRK
jgi:vacuolar-type H+-ATPase subunit H